MNLTEMLAELETTKKVMRNTLSSQKVINFETLGNCFDADCVKFSPWAQFGSVPNRYRGIFWRIYGSFLFLEIHGEASPHSNEDSEKQYLNGYGDEFVQPPATTGAEEQVAVVTVDGNQFAYGQEFSYGQNENSNGVLIYNAPQKPSQISCWTCDASNWNECAQVGFLEACDAQVRLRNSHGLTLLEK